MSWHLWVMIGKVALLAYCLLAVAVFMVVRRRRRHAQWADYMATDLEVLQGRGAVPGQPGHEASAHGYQPRTPLPDWMYDPDDDAGGCHR